MTSKATPVGGKILTPGYKLLLLLAGAGAVAIIYRFAVGLGASTAMNDGYPWGIWIAWDVVTGTAIACGGYAVALLVYILNRGHYHPLVRPAVLTSAIGYTLAGISVAIDVGRPWYLWRIPLEVWNWNGNSVLLEVAVCIMAYIVVLWLELAPAILEQWRDGDREKLRAFANRTLPFLEKALIYIIALGVLLPTMHQSSLGSLMLLAGPRLHPLWFTPLLPMFFLITCLGMGYAVVMYEVTASARFFGRSLDRQFLFNLEKYARGAGYLFLLMRFIDLIVRGNFPYALKPTFFALCFWIETLLFLSPALLGLLRGRISELQRLVGGGVLLVGGGIVYRFDVFLVGFQPGPGWRYFPSVIEILITAGLIAGEAAVYIALVKKFPILGGVVSTRVRTGRSLPASVAVAPAQ